MPLSLNSHPTDYDIWLEEYGYLRDAGFDQQTSKRLARIAKNTGDFRISKRHFRETPPPNSSPLYFDGDGITHFENYLGEIAPTPFSTPEKDAERAFFKQAEAEFAEDCEAETGVWCDPDKTKKRAIEKRQRAKNTHTLAMRLREGGLDAFRPDNCAFWRYYIHTRLWEQIPQYRRICFLPLVAASLRAEQLAALEYFLDRHPFCRFWTFTNGPRCKTSDLNRRLKSLFRHLSDLNRELRNRYGVEIIFRSAELGTLDGKDGGQIVFDENGNPLWHPHVHCVVISKIGYIRPQKWEEMIRFVHDFWGHHWDAGGLIRNPRECCKYVTKEADMLKLTPAQLVAVARQLKKVKMVQSMGALKKERARRAKENKVLRRWRAPDGGMVWRERLDHNKHADAHTDARNATRQQLLREQRLDEYSHMTPCPNPRKAVPFCRVAARLAPAVGPLGLKEPTVMVYGTHRDERAICNHELVTKLWSDTVEHFEAGRQLAAISVHTDTSSAEHEWQQDLPFYADTWWPPPDPILETPTQTPATI